jgi:hypothetical protein
LSKRVLKAQNAFWIWSVGIADALLLVVLAFPSVAGQAMSWLSSGARLGGAAIVPVAVLLLTSLVPSDAKAVLVFWRVKDVLPGHRAFSIFAQRDTRIDVERLRAFVGQYPETPREQNTLWYRLFKQVESDAGVAQAHRHFLLFRDLAALSFILMIIAPIMLLFVGAAPEAAIFVLWIMVMQYLATAIAARFHGERLVCNVLALHGASSAAKPRDAKGGEEKEVM